MARIKLPLAITLVLQVTFGSCQQDVSDFPAPARLGRRMQTQYRQINNGHPPDPYPRAKSALRLPENTMDEPAMERILDDIKEGMRYVLQTRNEYTFAIHGTATTGGGAVMDNLIEPGDKVLSLSTGWWGDVQANMAKRLGADLVHFTKEAGTRWNLSEIDAHLAEHRPKILAMVTGECDTGVNQPLDGVGDLCRKYDCLLVVDEAATAGVQPILMDKLKIDALWSNSHKGIGAVPGLAPVSFSPRAVQKIMNRQIPPRGYQVDFNLQYRIWNTSEPKRQRLQSISIPVFYSFREALATIAEEGIQKTYQRHIDTTRELHQGLEQLGLKYFVPNNGDRMISITTVHPPQGKNPVKIVDYMFERHNIKISSGYGPTTDRILRFATYAQNANSRRVRNILSALRNAIASPQTNI